MRRCTRETASIDDVSKNNKVVGVQIHALPFNCSIIGKNISILTASDLFLLIIEYLSVEGIAFDITLEAIRRGPFTIWSYTWQKYWFFIIRPRSEEHTSELQSLMRISYAVFCLKKKKLKSTHNQSKVHNKPQ